MLFLILAVTVFVVSYYYGTRTFKYWKKKGVKHEKPLPFVGNCLKQFIQKASIAMLATDLYRKFPSERVVGLYRGTRPELLLRDPELAKRVLATDFLHFHSRGYMPVKTCIEPIMRNVIFGDGDTWKLTRHRFSPAFSTGKLKAMFPLITKSAKKLQLFTDDIVERDHYDSRDLMARYTIDFIGECAFGIETDSLSNENSQFSQLGKRIFARNFRDGAVTALKLIFPEWFKGLKFIAPEIENTMVHLLRTVLMDRNYKPSGRNDFVDLLLELKEKGDLIGESIEKKKPNGEPELVRMELNDSLMAAQMFVFFGAGFETSSSASSYTLYNLAFNPDCQEKAQAEIDAVLKKYNNVLTYEAIKEMTYLEMAFNESLRMYPPVGYLVRVCCSKEYTFPELNLTIDENVKVVIPIQAIQNDDQYFENPTKYDPERFRSDSNDKIKNCLFLPFGDGPRACVAARLGQMQAMAGLAAVLQKYSVEPASCTVKNPQPDPTCVIVEGFIGGLPLKFRRRNR